MTHASKLFSKVLLITIFALPFAVGDALAHDRHHHGKGHGHHRHNDNYRPQQQCRQILQEFRISNFFTYSESGVACKDYNGVWQVVSDTKHPELYGKVYFLEHGRREYYGDVSPRSPRYEQNHEDWQDHDQGRDHNHDRNCRHNHGNDRDYGYLDKNNYRNR